MKSMTTKKHQPTAGTQGYTNSTEQKQEVVHQELTNIFNNNPNVFGNLQPTPEEEAQVAPPPTDTPTEMANTKVAVNILTEICTMLNATARPQAAAPQQTNQQMVQMIAAPDPGATPPPPLPTQGLDAEGIPITYCWSHGTTRNLSHTSATCSRKKEGIRIMQHFKTKLVAALEVVLLVENEKEGALLSASMV